MRDERLVGVWMHESHINSPGGAGGFAALTTVMTMELGADGVVRQYTQGVGGGADWSSDSGRQMDFEGEWRADGAVLSVMGMGLPDFRPAAQYQLIDDALVTQSDMGQLIWRRGG